MEFLDHFENILQQVEREDKNVMLVGDVNCDLLSEDPHCYTKLEHLQLHNVL